VVGVWLGHGDDFERPTTGSCTVPLTYPAVILDSVEAALGIRPG
jgi:hypothetical protein